jgi:O-antigen/teichoic acid export membrane protein
LSGIKKLAGQTLWYGVPTIVARFMGYLMNMALPFLFAQPAVTADITQVYAMIPFLNILFTYGMETAYFRFSQDKDKHQLFNTISIALFTTSLVFVALLYFNKESIARWANLEAHPEYILYMIGILLFDTLSTLPFAKLRQENRPRRYAFVRLIGILLNVSIVFLFLGFLPGYVSKHPDSPLRLIQQLDIGIGWYLIGNLVGSIITFLLLVKELRKFEWNFDTALFKEVMQYSYPLIIVGLGGMVNDVLSRLIYQHVVDLPEAEAKHELGIFANVYRLAVLITIFIQAFRMAAEPYFFNQAKEEGAQKGYARVMKFFVLACCFMFLLIGLNLDFLKWIITLKSAAWGEGIYIVPMLAMGNIFLGIYYNLSIWYKLTGKNLYGAYITLIGAAITILLNILLIPVLHYLGAAIATFACYLVMMILSYYWGQKYYPVPYAKKKLISYLVLVSLIVGLHRLILLAYSPLWFSLLTGLLLLAGFVYFVSKVEEKEWKKGMERKSIK